MTSTFSYWWLPVTNVWEKLLPNAGKDMHIIHMIPSNAKPYQTLATLSPVGNSFRNCTEIGTIISSEHIFHHLYICDTRSDTILNLQAV